MSERARQPRRQRHPAAHLPRGWRIFFIVSGWVLLIFGLALLPLPGPGALVIGFGAALLSLASESAWRALRWAFQRWPRGWRRLERARRAIYRKIVGPVPGP